MMNEKRIEDFNCKFAGKAARLTRRKGIYSLSRERETSDLIADTGEIVIILNAYCDPTHNCIERAEHEASATMYTHIWVLVMHRDALINLKCWNEDFGAILV